MGSIADDYVPPVGFAKEPAQERMRWFRRTVLALFLVGLGWLLLNGVISPPADDAPTPVESTDPVVGGI